MLSTPTTPAYPLHIAHHQLKDSQGRTVLWRGVNLGGNSKLPRGAASHLDVGFDNTAQLSFVGRPLELTEAAAHLERIRHWGFKLLRLVITWEAISPHAPASYDSAYLEYLRDLVALCHQHELAVWIDPHQDVWSRFTGGSGAPAWTLEAAGFDLNALHETGAALLHHKHKRNLLSMMWTTNYGKLAAATMFTLFFAGAHFAPHVEIEGENIQHYLQRHYLAALQQVVKTLQSAPNVIGYGSMNEPSAGFIGLQDLRQPANSMFMQGATPSAFEAMLLGAGFSRKVDIWRASLFKRGERLLNARGLSAWQNVPLWQEAGVWKLNKQGQPRLLRPDYFADADFYAEHWQPFIEKFSAMVHEHSPKALIFVEGEPADEHIAWQGTPPQGLVHAPHWYDGWTILLKRFFEWLSIDVRNRQLVWGVGRSRRVFAQQLGYIKELSRQHMPGMPLIIGEIGVPMNMHPTAFDNEDFSKQSRALDATLSGVERSLLPYVLWNYNPDNSNDHGDAWNGEDFSIFSPDQQHNPEDIDSGGRAVEAFCRPYAQAVAGEALEQYFKPKTGYYRFCFRCSAAQAQSATHFYVPHYHYGQGYEVFLSSGRIEADVAKQSLDFYPEQEGKHTLELRPQKA